MTLLKVLIYILAAPAVVFAALLGWPIVILSWLMDNTNIPDSVGLGALTCAAITLEIAWIVLGLLALSALGV